MDCCTLKKLRTYITAELGDAALYRCLSEMAPNKTAKTLLLEFASDEEGHAKEFQRQYCCMTGQCFIPAVVEPKLVGSYREILLDRVLDESGDYRKYAEQERMTCCGTLRDAYGRASVDESVHSQRLLYLLCSM